MPQVILTVPQEKIPALNNVLKELGIKMSSSISTLKTDFYKAEIPGSNANSTGPFSLIQKYFSWDNNRSELEFE